MLALKYLGHAYEELVVLSLALKSGRAHRELLVLSLALKSPEQAHGELLVLTLALKSPGQAYGEFFVLSLALKSPLTTTAPFQIMLITKCFGNKSCSILTLPYRKNSKVGRTKDSAFRKCYAVKKILITVNSFPFPHFLPSPTMLIVCLLGLLHYPQPCSSSSVHEYRHQPSPGLAPLNAKLITVM